MPVIYLYGVIPVSEKMSFGNIGLDGDLVYSIPFNDISTVVSNSTVLEYELTENNIKLHESVLRQIMSEYTLIPAEFGTVIYDNEILKRLVKRGYNSIQSCLRLVDGMVELGLKAVFRSGKDANAPHFPIDEMVEPIKKLVEQSISGEKFSDRLLFNMSFLVNKGNIGLISEEVTNLTVSYPELKFLYSGPWPPYNFIFIKIGKDGITVIKK